MHRIHIEYRHIQSLKNFSICSRCGSITIDSRHLVTIAQMVTFAISDISPTHRVLSYIYRSYGTICPRNLNHDNLFAFNLLLIYHVISQDVHANLLTVVHHVPKVTYQFM